MVTLEDLECRIAALGSDGRALLDRLAVRAAPLLDRMPIVPATKALLSKEGGICPGCGGPLTFDPWRPADHRCADCDAVVRGARHDAHWARAQHLWVAERAAHLATVAVFTDDKRYADRARDLLRAYYQLYFDLPNQDNVLGPSHLFFSTYLESIWILNYLAAAFLLRERGWLDESDVEGVNAIADEAAQIIGEFDEGMSNRQTWNAAALTAIAAWFGDEELGQSTVEGRTGLIGHLTEGFGDDGMWHEGENYHLFAVRGLLHGIEWARVGGADLWADPAIAAQLGFILMAPAKTALPDFTFPARKDSRFGVSLDQPAYVECWEVGLARMSARGLPELEAWLAGLYGQPSMPAQTYDAYLHDAGEPPRSLTTRADLSWWMLLTMRNDPPAASSPYRPASTLLGSQGVALLRRDDRYLAMECGAYGGGHGHPDRLHLTLHAGGVHWLADPGTGSYVQRDLFWYRSTLAHNAPRLNGESQDPGDAQALAFDSKGDFGWMAASFGDLRRIVVSGPDWVLDVVEVEPGVARQLEVPWHLDGEVAVVTPGSWQPADLGDEFATDAARFEPAGGADVVLEARHGDQRLRLHLVGGVVLRATGPGRPGASARPFYLVRAEPPVRLVALIDLGADVTQVNVSTDKIDLVAPRGPVGIRFASAAVTVTGPAGSTSLGGAVPAPPERKVLMADRPLRAEGQAFAVPAPPVLDGTLEGFDTSAPLEMADEGHYYRSEDPYPGPEGFAAAAFVNWDHDCLYVAVDVSKPEVLVRPADAEPLGLDNDPEDIHSDGIQIYARVGDAGAVAAYLIRPADDGGILVRPIPGSPDQLTTLAGGSMIGENGYTITVAIPLHELGQAGRSASVQFDVLINEMRPGRQRRAGQLAWGGGGGWVYLRSDYRDPWRWGTLELLG